MPFDPENPTAEQQRLLDWVYHRMDYVGVDGQTEAVEPATVWRELTQAARTLLLNAPAPKVYLAAETTTGTAQPHGTGFAFSMPAGAIRPLRLSSELWEAATHFFRDPSHALMYELMGKRTTVSRPHEPSAFIVPSAAGIKIEGYPRPEEAATVPYELQYIGQAEPTDVPPELQDAMVWEGAALVLIGTREYQAAEAARANVPTSLLTANTHDNQ